MHGRFAAAVPIAMWNACWEYHKSSRTGLISLTLDLQAHGAAEDVEQLVDHVLSPSQRSSRRSPRKRCIPKIGAPSPASCPRHLHCRGQDGGHVTDLSPRVSR